MVLRKIAPVNARVAQILAIDARLWHLLQCKRHASADGTMSTANSNAFDPQRKKEVLEAAARCIRQLGVRKVSIEDIAREAGTSRRTLYRLYPNRRAVLRSLIFHRLEQIALTIQGMMHKCKSFEECVVRGSVQTIKIANRDKVYRAIFEDDRTLILDDSDHPTEQQIEPLFLSTWKPIFDRGREEGKIPKQLTDHQLADWVMSIHQMLEWRQDMSEAEQTELLRVFVLPSLRFAGELEWR